MLGALGMGALGCGEPVDPLGPGSATLAWEVGLRGCEDSGVAQIMIELQSASQQQEPAPQVVPCEAHEVHLEGLEPGHYVLRVTGQSAQGVTLMRAPAARVVSYADEAVRWPVARLSAADVPLEVRWPTDHCTPDEQVVLEVFDRDQALLWHAQALCAQGARTITGLSAGDRVLRARSGALSEVIALKLTVGERAQVEVRWAR